MMAHKLVGGLIPVFVFAFVFCAAPQALAACTGRFVNPITDVCWECMFPISIGGTSVNFSGTPDTLNPSSPLCACGTPIPRAGLAIGLWEPARLADVSREPWCFPNLGGLTIDGGAGIFARQAHSSSNGESHGASWHVHWYVYPLLSWIGALIDIVCLEGGGFDVFYLTELDPLWLDDELSFLINPEAALFGTLPAQAACAADCGAASAGLPLDPLFWCAGCQGSMYPLSGNITAHVGGVQSSLMAAERFLFKLHRELLAWGTMGQGALCGRIPMPIMPKSQYRWQMTQPIPATLGILACNPTGRSSVFYETLREIPIIGENFGYLVWRKRNCCVF